MAIEDYDAQTIRFLEEQKKRNDFGPTGLHPDRVTLESASNEQLKVFEAMRKDNTLGPSGIHPDRVTIENSSDDQLNVFESMRKRTDFGPSGVHPDRVSIENMSEDQLRGMQAMVEERRRIDRPFKDIISQMVNNPKSIDSETLENTVIRSMQSNSLISSFVNAVRNRLNVLIDALKSCSVDEREQIEELKTELESLVHIYEKFLYTLKSHRWNFADINFGVDSLKFSESIQQDIWRIQKNQKITFNLPIPVDLGEYYGNKYERMGRMIPGLTLMYDELNNKEVNWHQVMIYKPNELTPYQRFLKSQEEKKKRFEEARSSELAAAVEPLRNNQQEIKR